MTSTYKQIKSRFLSKIEDYKYLIESEDEINEEFFKEWLHSAIAKPQTRKLFSTVLIEDNSDISFELNLSVDEFSDKEFVTEVLAYGVAIGWLEPKVYTVVNIQQMYGGKEQKFYAQANHVKAIQDLLERLEVKLNKLIRDHGTNNNSYLRGE